MKRQKIKGYGTCIGKAVLFVLIFVLLFSVFQRLLQAKWVSQDGSSTTTWIEYRNLEENTVDVLFLGTSHVYSAIDPMYIYQNSGITSYTISEGSLRFDLTYLALEEALKTQSPQIVFLDMSAIRFGEQQEEALTHRLSDQLPISLSKLEYAFNNGNEDLTPLDVLFPLFRFHSRWDELDETDFQYLTGTLEETYTRGHLISYKTVSTRFRFYDEDGRVSKLTDYDMDYIQRIYDLCEKNGIELILFKIPAPVWYLAESEAAEEIAESLGVTFWEMYYEIDEIGLDPETDFRDKKNHMNQSGAEKVSAYIMEYLMENYDLEDQRESNEEWDEDLIKYEVLIAESIE